VFRPGQINFADEPGLFAKLVGGEEGMTLQGCCMPDGEQPLLVVRGIGPDAQSFGHFRYSVGEAPVAHNVSFSPEAVHSPWGKPVMTSLRIRLLVLTDDLIVTMPAGRNPPVRPRPRRASCRAAGGYGTRMFQERRETSCATAECAAVGRVRAAPCGGPC